MFQKAFALDQLIFDEGFNKCNLTLTENLLAEDLTFYHDIAGVQNKEQFMKAMRENICGSTEKIYYKINT